MRVSKCCVSLALSLVVVSACQGEPPTAPSLSPLANLDGETVFRGLVFGEGEVAERVPEISRATLGDHPEWTPDERAAVNSAKNQLVAGMHRLDPTFFARFGADIQSGDYLRIERALDETGKLAGRVTKPVSSEVSAGDAEGTCVLAILAVYVATAVTIQAVVALNFVVDFNFAFTHNLFWVEPTGAGSKLQRDQAVHLIAQRLAGT